MNSPRPPRVLLTIRHFPPDGGGAEVVALQVSRMLVQWGVPMRVLTGRYGGRLPSEQVHGIPVLRHFVGPYIKGTHEFCYLASLVWQLIRLREEYDIIHTFQINLSTFVAVAVAGILGKKVVATAHGAGETGDVALWGKIPLGEILLRGIVSRLDGCTGVSREVVNDLGAAGFHGEKTWYIPNGVSLSNLKCGQRKALSKKLGIPKNALLGVFAGRLSKEKDPELLLQAWRDVYTRNKALHLVFVGDGDMRSSLEAKAKQMGLDQCLTFTGWVDNVGAYLACADFFLLPSIQEGMPLVLLEAMAAGLPVIASKIGGVKDIIEHGVNGLLFNSGDLHALTAHILSLAKSSAFRKKLGEKGKNTVKEHYTLDASCRRYCDFYKSILNS